MQAFFIFSKETTAMPVSKDKSGSDYMEEKRTSFDRMEAGNANRSRKPKEAIQMDKKSITYAIEMSISRSDPTKILLKVIYGKLRKAIGAILRKLCEYKYGRRCFLAKKYYISTVGANKAAIAKYIREQEMEDQMSDRRRCCRLSPWGCRPVSTGR